MTVSGTPPGAEELLFLRALVAVGGKTTRRGLPQSCRAQDVARKACKDRKWARYAAFERDGRSQFMWAITAAGRRVVGPEATGNPVVD